MLDCVSGGGNIFTSTTQTRKAAEMKTTTKLDQGNNESLSRGINVESDGTFTAMTFTQSKNFKTKRGAELWLAKKMSK